MRRKIPALALLLGAALPMLFATSSVRASAQAARNTDTSFSWSGTVQTERWVYVRNLNGPVRVEAGTGTRSRSAPRSAGGAAIPRT